jgi:hypothetical protein
MHHQHEQQTNFQRNWRTWYWWPIAIALAGLLINQSRLSMYRFSLYPYITMNTDLPFVQSLIAGFAIGIASWVALKLILRHQKYLWGILIVTLASYLLTTPFINYSLTLSHAIIPYYSGHTVRIMFLQAIAIGLPQWGALAVLQALFFKVIIRVSWRYALLWILVGIGVGIAAPIVGILADLLFYTPSHSPQILGEYIVYGLITGLPLIWLIPHDNTRWQKG